MGRCAPREPGPLPLWTLFGKGLGILDMRRHLPFGEDQNSSQLFSAKALAPEVWARTRRVGAE